MSELLLSPKEVSTGIFKFCLQGGGKNKSQRLKASSEVNKIITLFGLSLLQCHNRKNCQRVWILS